jgi:hypothetical protein
MHKNVNRTSDIPSLDPRDVGDECFQDRRATHVRHPGTVSALWKTKEDPSDLDYQNERTRDNATWLALTQVLTEKDSISFGWGHAGATPGDPGQHNTPGGANPDNSANLYSLAWRHMIDKNTTIYVDYAMTDNHADAHYDLGAGGHGVTTDCHDSTPMAAFDATTGGQRRPAPRAAGCGESRRRHLQVLNTPEPSSARARSSGQNRFSGDARRSRSSAS